MVPPTKMINSVTLFLVRELRQTFIFFLPCHCISPARSCLRSSRPLTFPLGIEASFRSCVTHNTRAWKNEREGRIVVVVVVVARFTLGGGDSQEAQVCCQSVRFGSYRDCPVLKSFRGNVLLIVEEGAEITTA